MNTMLGRESSQATAHASSCDERNRSERTAIGVADYLTGARKLALLRRELARLEKAAAKAGERRAALPAGSSRARVTTANARWARAAEARDRVERELAEALEADDDERQPR